MNPIVGSIVALVTPMHEDGFGGGRYVQRIVAVNEAADAQAPRYGLAGPAG